MSLLAIAGALTLVGVGEACEDALNKGQQPGNTCSGKHATVVEAELNRVWRAAVPILRERDRAGEELYSNPGYFDLILEEQRAWIRYRSAKCAIERHELYGGSAANWTYNYCMVEMAIERIEYIKKLADLEEL